MAWLMRRDGAHIRALSVAAIVLAAVVVSYGQGTAWTPSPTCWLPPPSPPILPLSRDQTDLVRAGKLEQAARLGPVVVTRNGPEGVTRDLTTLAAKSRVISLAAVQDCVSYVAADRFASVRTVYQFSTVEVLKGSLDGPLVSVDILGGRVLFDSKLVAELRIEEFVAPRSKGQEYLLFLTDGLGVDVYRDSPISIKRSFHLTNSGYGAFELMKDGTVKSAITSKLGIAGVYDGKSSADLISDVRKVVGRVE